MEDGINHQPVQVPKNGGFPEPYVRLFWGMGSPGARVRPSTRFLTNQLLGILPTDGLVLGFCFTVLVLGFSFRVWF